MYYRGENLGNQYGEGSGEIILDQLGCEGTERVVDHCTHDGWIVNNCDHSEDVSIRCHRGKPIAVTV